MTETKYKKFLNIILVIVVIAIVGVIGYVVYEYIYLRNIIDANASDILDAFDKYMTEINKNKEDNRIIVTAGDSNNQEDSNQNSGPSGVGNYANTSTGYSLTYGGYGVLGKIELPKVGLKYPILETMTDANAIDVSVAVQYGVRFK